MQYLLLPVGQKLDIDIIANYATMLGFGSKTGIDLPNEKKGLFPTKAWKLHHLKQKWFPVKPFLWLLVGA